MAMYDINWKVWSGTFQSILVIMARGARAWNCQTQLRNLKKIMMHLVSIYDIGKFGVNPTIINKVRVG